MKLWIISDSGLDFCLDARGNEAPRYRPRSRVAHGDAIGYTSREAAQTRLDTMRALGDWPLFSIGAAPREVEFS